MRKTRASEKTAEFAEIRNMVMYFRVSDLQTLLRYAQCNKGGRKSELQERALALIDSKNLEIIEKIKEIYREQQISFNLASSEDIISSIDLTTSHSPQRPVTRNMYQQNTILSVPDNNRGAPHTNGVVNPYNTNNLYPIQPDVRLKKLAFFDTLATLLKPSTLVPATTQRVQETNFYFHLTPSQATDIATNRDIRNSSKIEHIIQVQLRFCLLETSCEQDDHFPPSIAVKVNGKQCQLPNPIPTNKPGVEPKRPPRPVNITSNVKLSPLVSNNIHVSWCSEYNRVYVISVYLVKKLTSFQLLQRLKTKGIKAADFTRALIKEKLNEDADCEIATTMLRVSLVCPLGKMRMTTPCRASTCSHLQCFDAHLYLQMNERKPTWNCPVCDKPALYENLVIDGYFQEVLASPNLSLDDNEIQFHKDGSWSTHILKNDTQMLDTPNKSIQKIEVISDDLEVITTDTLLPPVKAHQITNNNNTNNEPTSTTSETVVDLTFSDSDDDLPLKRKQGPARSNQNTNKAKINDSPSTSVIMLDSPSPPSTPNPLSNSPKSNPYSNNLNVTSTTSSINNLHQDISPLEDPNYQINPLAINRGDLTIEPVVAHQASLNYGRHPTQNSTSTSWNNVNVYNNDRY